MAGKGKEEGGAGKAAQYVVVTLERACAEELLYALSRSLGVPCGKKGKSKNGKNGKNGKGDGKGDGGKGNGGKGDGGKGNGGKGDGGKGYGKGG